MSRIRELTGKGRQLFHNVHHANNKTIIVLLRTYKFRVPPHGLRPGEQAGGLDTWLLKTADTKLSQRALKVKRELVKKQAA